MSPTALGLAALVLLLALVLPPAGTASGGGPALAIGAFPGATAWVPVPAPPTAPLPAGWGAEVPGTRPGTVFEWLPRGESWADWTRIVTYDFIRVPDGGPAGPEAVRDRMLAQCAASGPETSDLATRNRPFGTPEAIDLLFAWHVAGCAGQPEQTQITRLIRAPGGIHRLSYTVKGPMPPGMEETWETWIAGVPAIERP